MKKILIILGIILIIITTHLTTHKNENKITKVQPKTVPQTIIKVFKANTNLNYDNVNDDKTLRESFKKVYEGTDCGLFNEPRCLKNNDFGSKEKFKFAGLILKDNSVMLFHYEPGNNYGSLGNESGIGSIYYDSNGDNEPNDICEDRFVYRILKNRISLDVMLPCVNSDEPMPFVE